jgi:ribosomal protein S8E
MTGVDLRLHVVNVNSFSDQVYDRVKGGDEYQKKLDVLPTRVAECEEAIRQEQAQVESKQAEKVEQVQLCKIELPPLPVMLTMSNVLPATHAAHIIAIMCTSAAKIVTSWLLMWSSADVPRPAMGMLDLQHHTDVIYIPSHRRRQR